MSFGYVSIKQLRNQLWKLGEQFEAGLLAQPVYSQQVEKLERYLDQWSDRTDTDAVPHPQNAEGVRLAFNLYAHGNISDHGIALALNEAGYRTTGNWGERLFEGDTKVTGTTAIVWISTLCIALRPHFAIVFVIHVGWHIGNTLSISIGFRHDRLPSEY